MWSRKTMFCVLVIVLLLLSDCDARRRRRKSQKKSAKQKEYELRETNPPNFVRLLVMRVIYGIASQMGFEERLSSIFNGAFVPPGADEGGDYLDFIGDLPGGGILDGI